MVTVLWALIRTLTSETTGLVEWLLRCSVAAGLGVLTYGVLDQWPRHLPRWAPRWILQLLAVLIVMPPAVYLGYVATLGTFDVLSFGTTYRDGLLITSFMGILVGPWIALGAQLHRSEAFAREQALAFQLRSSELERKALDARLRLLQAQVEPHFLFNTLANIRSLVRRSGSADATAMLDNLIDYLRAALPRLGAGHETFEEEQQIVCAYLELMRMRMPDRLTYTVRIDPAALVLHCPPMTLTTLVENAIKHGIDPSEAGGTVDVLVTVRDQRVQVRVADTGVGLQAQRGDLVGTGLANLRERLTLAFGDKAQVRLGSAGTDGTVAEAEFPAHRGDPT
ncbi:sensor histidine kinase [Piscinibacter sp.]|uniref:sensor histidine kinase n=1 Tax=Piscinibacter sp. TaxID=1903157 RepID=UPI0011D77F77|nr:MAG: sensor histidine kinase [Burkholderiaceae bacterium]